MGSCKGRGSRVEGRGNQQLLAWQRAIDVVALVYEVSDAFPDRERYALTAQLRRAVVSIPANIAEGYGCTHRGDYLHHLSIARGSLMEVETLLIVAVRVGLCDREATIEAWRCLHECGRLLAGLIQSLGEERFALAPPPTRPSTLDPRPNAPDGSTASTGGGRT